MSKSNHTPESIGGQTALDSNTSNTPQTEGLTPSQSPQPLSAWDACGQYPEQIGEDYQVIVQGGHTRYDSMTVGWGIYGATIRLQRFDTRSADWPPKVITRYIKPDTVVQLVPYEPRLDAQRGESDGAE